jgi:hypothetical protein
LGVGFDGVLDDAFGQFEFARAQFFLRERAAGGFLQEVVEVDAFGLAVFVELAEGFAVEGGEDVGVGVVAVEVVVRAEEEEVVAQERGDVVAETLVAELLPAGFDAAGERVGVADVVLEAAES